MTEDEAIKEIRVNMSTIGLSNEAAKRVVEARDMAINALEKQIQKKPIMKPYYEDMKEEYLCCPACGEILTDRIPMDNKDFYFHCLNCGQKLNWESD